MLLRNCDFKISYGPNDDRLHNFFLPALSASVHYDRAAGYFSSAMLAIAAAGIARLIHNDGRMRLLVGADLSENDVIAIQKGHELQGLLAEKFCKALEDIEDMLVQRRLEGLAWMIAKGTLEIRVVIPRDKNGLPIPAPQAEAYYHPKEGIFTDGEGNQVAFCGSINESRQAIEFNYESFMVYKSWDNSRPYLAQVVSRFERLWEKKEPDWIALPIPDAVTAKLLRFRPQKAPEIDPTELVKDKQEEYISEGRDADQNERILFQFVKDAPHLPNAAKLGIRTSTVEPWPHQTGIIEAIVERFPESFLLCDEVGLGKTIEAGLAIRQLVISGRVRRCLILVPKSVARQWQEELYEKSVLNIPLYDGHSFTDVFGKQIASDSSNPWDAFPIIIASSQLAKRRDRQEELTESTNWDLIVVDEAHHARRREFLREHGRPNRLLELLGGKLKQKTQGLLLLTATPMQVHPVEVWDLLRLLGMGGRWGALEENFLKYFEELRKPFDGIEWRFILAMLRDHLDTGGKLEHQFCEFAEEKVGNVEWSAIRELPWSRNYEAVLRQLTKPGRTILKEMAHRHTPVRRFMFRSTRDLLREYHKKGLLTENVPVRDPQPEWIPMTSEEFELYERIEKYIRDFYRKYEAERKGLGFIMTVYRQRLTSSFYALRRSLERRLAFILGREDDDSIGGLVDDDIEQEDLQLDFSEDISEEDRKLFLEEVQYISDFLTDLSLIGNESKLEQLLQDLSIILRKRETVLVFTQYTDTMDYLRDRLKEVYGSQVACYSGRGGEYWDGEKWEHVSKEQIKNDFRSAEHVKILVCSPAASEGLNLQTCGVLINYDMPWNPMRVEQRIGRIDRIGQVHSTVWVRNYFYEDTVEAQIYRRLDSRIASFEHVVGELQPILARVARTIEAAVMVSGSARESLIQDEVKAINDELRSRETEILELDKLADSAVEAPSEETVPINLRDLEELLINSSVLGSRFSPHPKIVGAYQFDWGGKLKEVTFDSNLFDKHPNTLKFMSYGNPLLEDVLKSIEHPRIARDVGSIARSSVNIPITLLSYYFSTEDGLNQARTIRDIKKSITDPNKESRVSVEQIEDIRQKFEKEIECTLSNEIRIEIARKKAEASALEEEARQILLQAAYVELAIGQQADLFGPEIVVDFSEDALQRLARHGYPFKGLLAIVDIEGVRPRATDDFFQRIQNHKIEPLKRRFEGIRERAKDLLRRMASQEKIEPEGVISSPSFGDIETEIFASEAG